MSLAESISPLIARFVLAWFFMNGAWSQAADWDATVLQMAIQQIPVPPVMLAGGLVVAFLGSLSLLFGFQAKLGAVALFAYAVIGSVLMHDYWTLSNASARAAEFEIFARDMAIAGGLLLVVGLGPGPFAIDNRGKRR